MGKRHVLDQYTVDDEQVRQGTGGKECVWGWGNGRSRMFELADAPLTQWVCFYMGKRHILVKDTVDDEQVRGGVWVGLEMGFEGELGAVGLVGVGINNVFQLADGPLTQWVGCCGQEACDQSMHT